LPIVAAGIVWCPGGVHNVFDHLVRRSVKNGQLAHEPGLARTRGGDGRSPTSIASRYADRAAEVREGEGDAYILSNPVGTGPFGFVRWRTDDELVLSDQRRH
jgi:hypothetical protein